jgi:hypothetical protein
MIDRSDMRVRFTSSTTKGAHDLASISSVKTTKQAIQLNLPVTAGDN